jgi:hypothetical protein
MKFQSADAYAAYIQDSLQAKGMDVSCTAIWGAGCWLSCRYEHIEEAVKFVRENVYNFETVDNQPHRYLRNMRTIHLS